MSKIISLIKSNKFLYSVCLPFARLYEGILWFPMGASRIWKLCLLPVIRSVMPEKKGFDIAKYKDCEKGKRIFIICSGPSLTMEDIDKIKNEVTIGVNGVISLYSKIGWQPKYYVVADKVVLDGYYDEINLAHPQNAIFCRTERDKRPWTFTPTYCGKYLDIHLAYARHRSAGDKVRKYMYFEDDLAKKGLYTAGRSVATYAMQIAAYMGASEIILLGQDCDYGGDKKYFNDKVISNVNADTTRTFIETMFVFYEYAKEHLKKRGIKVYNATRGGKLEVFDRIDLDELVGKNG